MYLKHGNHGLWTLVVGALILVNFYLLEWEWWMFIGVLLMAMGVVKMLVPDTYCKPAEAPAKKKK